MIYRKFLRPRELLEMFIERFEELGEFVDDDDEEARNTRLRYVIRHISPAVLSALHLLVLIDLQPEDCKQGHIFRKTQKTRIER